MNSKTLDKVTRASTTTTAYGKSSAPMPPPRVQSSCARPSVRPPPPPIPSVPPVPPVRNSSMPRSNFVSKYETLFKPLNQLPKPETFTNCAKSYPSQKTLHQKLSAITRRNRPAPQPPSVKSDQTRLATQDAVQDHLIQCPQAQPQAQPQIQTIQSQPQSDSMSYIVTEQGGPLGQLNSTQLTSSLSAMSFEPNIVASSDLDVAKPTSVISALLQQFPTVSSRSYYSRYYG
ncbi:hypothetical protein GZH46_02382, partial [Fragariocoptes setiger]